ncbi:MAG TPA: hydantoinase/oxoprolinase family protein [Solirubrobacteraceae bacterium]|jgi:N-methylhydantoinase A|nr:hydantoinase/oxoprolinase family protein [Solirubrobacteraceae bacterium]
MLLGVDVGGTFTDAALVLEGRLHTAKSPTTPEDQSVGALAAVDAVLAAGEIGPERIGFFGHGMTVATNALLEGAAARTALVATEGFTDIVELGRQARAHLYRLCAAHPAPLVPAERRFAAPERMTPAGPLRPLDEIAAGQMIGALAAARPEAVAVVLLHSYADPAHERRLGELIAARLPGTHVSLSHDLVGTFREYERAATTELDAALSPLVAGYLRRLEQRAQRRGLPRPSIMQSSGGLTSPARAASHAALTVLSGPAGGVAGAALLARRLGLSAVLCLDMGGTSCDVGVIEDGRPREAPEGRLGGRVVALPMLDVHTVGAGGGSVAWRDPGGALRVGPRSAGARPGPAAYDRGGSEPTVTDASLLLGHLDEATTLAGGVALSRPAAARAIGTLARELHLEPRVCAEGIVRVADAEMARAMSVMTVERGLDPRAFALLAFGGAGPLHACALADQLGISTIVCPRASGVLSALGLAAAPRRSDAQRSVLLTGWGLTSEAIAAEVDELVARARAHLDGSEGSPTASYDLRYRGQSFELTVAGAMRPDPRRLREDFELRHEELYGYRDHQAEIELVSVRVSVMTATPAIDLEAQAETDPLETPPRRQPDAHRLAVFAGREHQTRVLRGPPPAGEVLSGPGIIELPEATLLVAPGWSASADRSGTTTLRRQQPVAAEAQGS